MSFFLIVCLTYVLSTSFMWHKEFRSSLVANHSHVQHRHSYSGFTWLFTYREMPNFYLMMDIVRPVESFAMWPQMITQEHVPDALYLHDWWLPDVCSGEGRKRYHFYMFLSNTTPWSSGEGRHMVCKRWCSWRGQIKHRTSGTPHFDSHHLCFLCTVPDHEDCFPAYPKAEKQGEERSQVVAILTRAESLEHTNPNKTLYRNHSELWLLLGQMQPSEATSLLVKGCSGDGTRVLSICQGPAMHEGHGPATGSGQPEGLHSLQFRFSHSIPLSIGNVIHTTFTEQENIRKIPADISNYHI